MDKYDEFLRDRKQACATQQRIYNICQWLINNFFGDALNFSTDKPVEDNVIGPENLPMFLWPILPVINALIALEVDYKINPTGFPGTFLKLHAKIEAKSNGYLSPADIIYLEYHQYDDRIKIQASANHEKPKIMNVKNLILLTLFDTILAFMLTGNLEIDALDLTIIELELQGIYVDNQDNDE